MAYNNFYPTQPSGLQNKMKLNYFADHAWPFALTLTLLIAMGSLADCNDPLDPNGNITVTYDILRFADDVHGYVARITIQNYYQYRHVDKPGWKLGWTWAEDEIILSMSGAFATEQGNCSIFRYNAHSCKKDPVIADLMPESPEINKTEGCCQGGLLSAYAINPAKSFTSFQFMVGNLGNNDSIRAPKDLTLMAPGPGYTCSSLDDAEPTVSEDIGGRRIVQVFKTWKSTCTYSAFVAKKLPVCCVSLSTFYNPKITSCHECSCGCRDADQTASACILQDSYDNLDIVQCTDHMCPVRVHWHVMTNYVDYWRVKLTVSNYHYRRNYTNWNVLVQHPAFSQNATAFTFNSSIVPSPVYTEQVALFWGISYVNEELLEASDDGIGSVTTEILLKKDMKSFTFRNGWAFPRRLYFNGEDCAMPLPDTFPMLPNASPSTFQPTHYSFLLLILLIHLIFPSQMTVFF